MNKSKSILFLGDVVPYKPFRFKNNYNTIINLECPITKTGKPAKDKINLKVSKNNLGKIFGTNLLCVSLGNNHILDFGKEGLKSTQDVLNKMNVRWFGVNKATDDEYQPLIIDYNNKKIALISAVCPSTSPILESDGSYHIDLLDINKILKKVTQIKKSIQIIILYIHWGIEESSLPATEDILIARKMIEAGVDVVVGSHAHAPQSIEKYKEGIIAYNLGNFLMPELKNVPSYFDDNGNSGSFYNKRIMPWNRISWGLLIDTETMKFKIIKYMFLYDRIIRLHFTPFNKYLKLNSNSFNDNYKILINKHLKKRKTFRKIVDFLNKPHMPLKLKKILWS